MKKGLYAFALIFSFSSFGQVKYYEESSDLPLLNKKIIEYVNSVLGKRVDRGECWDLAFRALETSGAYFDRNSKKTVNVYGRLLDLTKEEVMAGDLIQFERVKLNYIKNGKKFYGYAKKHTCLLYTSDAADE